MDESTMFSICITSNSEEQLTNRCDMGDSASELLDFLVPSSSSASNNSIFVMDSELDDPTMTMSNTGMYYSDTSMGDLEEEDSSFDDSGVLKEEIERYTFPFKFKGETSVDSNTSLVENCSICMSPFVNEENVRRLPCMHLFHSECVDPWLEKKMLCPNCNMDVITGAEQKVY